MDLRRSSDAAKEDPPLPLASASYAIAESAPRPLNRQYNLSASSLVLLFAAAMTLVYNQRFWQIFLDNSSVTGLGDVGFLAAGFALMTLWFSFFFNFVAFRPTLKPALIGVLLVASLVNYFSTRYGAIIDSAMIQSLFDTDLHESAELISEPFIAYLGSYFLAPAVLLACIPIRYPAVRRQVLQRMGLMVLCLAGLTALFFGFNKDFSFLFRQHPELRSLINPTYPVYSLVKVVREANSVTAKLTPIGTDAKQNMAYMNNKKKRVFVFVVGETARARNFSLNGYRRDTNPELARAGVTNFSNAGSCGTSTAESLPCMFSHLSREDYSPDQARRYENLLDVLNHAGVPSVWIDNQMGCKGLCDRSDSISTTQYTDARYCSDGECRDEIMLAELEKQLNQYADSGDHFLVLHQEGSHGPAYYKRVPDDFRKFQPECRSVNLQDCSSEEVVNSYDNTILYTDHFLAQVIHTLESYQKEFDLVMYYVSDHGESLGEKGLYLHGMPYLLAPEGQTHVPSVLWMSDGFQARMGVSKDCLDQQADQPISHDHIFHSVLGALGVNTRIYQPELDLFRRCEKS